jgi:hypothetical protein
MSDVIRFPHLIETPSQTAPALSADIKMSDLYAAPAKTMGADSRTAAVDTVLDTVSDFIPRHSPLPETVTGWRNQELADLYRTQRILALAGITTKVDRGLTDEGDPWFVFMDSLDEVFVHFSRIDGRYLVTSLMQDKPVWGDSLHDLVSEFSKQVQPVAQAPGAGRNVVSIAGRSRNAVLIHPAAALAALVWSVYLMSDDLVAATPMVTADTPDAAAEAPTADLADNLADDLNILPEVSQKALQVLSDPEFTKQVADPYAGRDNSGAALQMAALSTGISMKAVGLSLSLVALSVGLPLLETNEDAESDTAQNQLSIAQLYTLITRAKEAALSVLVATQDEQQQHASQTEHLIDDIRAQNAADPTDDTQNIETSAEFAELVHSIATSYETEVQTILALKQAAAARQPQQAETDAASADNAAGPEAAAPAQTVSTLKPVQDTSLADNSFLLRFDTAFESFTLTSLDVIAQTELAELMTVNTTTADIIAPLTTPHVATNKFEAFDQEARMFLDFLLRTYSDIKVVSLPTEIIFIHVDAFELADVDHPIYAKSWSFDDGGVISTIGLKSDMAQFDLIA